MTAQPLPPQASSAEARPTVLVIDMAQTSFGGTEQVMLHLLPLVNQRWRVVFFDMVSNPRYAQQLRDRGVEVLHLLPEPRRKFVGGRGTVLRPFLVAQKLPWLVLTLIRLRRWLRENRPDAVYFNRREVVWATRAVVPKAVPRVFHSHGFSTVREFPRKIIRLLNRRFCRVVGVSDRTARMLAEAGVEANLLVRVYNGIDADSVRRAAAAPGPPMPVKAPGDVVFLQVAVLSPHKGQVVAIDALTRMKGRSAKLWICGGTNSPQDHQYERALKLRVGQLGLSDRVTFLGWRDDVPRVMAQADVILLPSKTDSESFGMVLVEGMALGKPCIGTSRGGVPEVVADGVTGLVREPTPEAFAEAMTFMASEPEARTSMGLQSRIRVEDTFGIRRQADEIIRILDIARR